MEGNVSYKPNLLDKKQRPEGVESSDSCSDDEYAPELDTIKPKTTAFNKGRTSVSAEVYGTFNKKQKFEPKVVPKTEEQRALLRERFLECFMFQSLDEKELETIINAAEEKKVKEGEFVIKQDDDGDHLYVVISGNLKCTKIFTGEKDPKFLLNYTPGSAFGELALLYNVPRAATIQATEDTTLYSLDRECFNHIVKGAAHNRREQYIAFLEKVDILKTLDS